MGSTNRFSAESSLRKYRFSSVYCGNHYEAVCLPVMGYIAGKTMYASV